MNQFGSMMPGDAQVCARCEAMLMDVLDGTASPDDQAFFDRHVLSCTSCSEMLMDAKRGGAWLEMLRDPRPEPTPMLMERILAGTTGALRGDAGLAGAGMAVGPNVLTPEGLSSAGFAMPAVFAGGQAGVGGGSGGAKVLPFRMASVSAAFGHRMVHPRLAMTAAMAFFSITLTLNLTGVHVSELRASDLRPANIRRGFYAANAHAVRYYENLRVVYELEARVRDLQRSSDDGSSGGQGAPGGGTGDEPGGKSAAPSKTGDKPAGQPDGKSPNAKPRTGPGTSRSEPLTPDIRSVAKVGCTASAEGARYRISTCSTLDPVAGSLGDRSGDGPSLEGDLS